MAKAIFLIQQSGPAPPLTEGLSSPSIHQSHFLLGPDPCVPQSQPDLKGKRRRGGGGAVDSRHEKWVFQNPAGSKCLNFSACFIWKRCSACPLWSFRSGQFPVAASMEITVSLPLSLTPLPNVHGGWAYVDPILCWGTAPDGEFGPEQKELLVRNPAPFNVTIPNSQGHSAFYLEAAIGPN